MRTAFVAVVGLLAGCVGTSDRKAVRGPGQDMYGRTYLRPDRPEPPAAATMTPAAGEPAAQTHVANAPPVVALPTPVPPAAGESGPQIGGFTTEPPPTTRMTLSMGGPDADTPPTGPHITGEAAREQITARAQQVKSHAVRIENGASALRFRYKDGSAATITTGDGPTEFRYYPAR